MTIRERITATARELDRAINLGVSAAYPLIFNMPVPDPPPDWKEAVRLGWRVVRLTVRETVHVLRLERRARRARLRDKRGV